MNLDFFKKLENGIKNIDTKGFIDEFMNELTDYLNNSKQKENIEMSKQENIEEDCLYQVVDRGLNGIYLQNTNSGVIFEETNIPEEIRDVLGNDDILRYKNGTYIIEEELTRDFLDSLVDVSEYKKIQEDFIKNTNISEIDSNTQFKVVSKDGDYTLLNYGDNEKDRIRVPNVLLPYFMNDKTILYYENGKFYK